MQLPYDIDFREPPRNFKRLHAQMSTHFEELMSLFASSPSPQKTSAGCSADPLATDVDGVATVDGTSQP